MWSFSQGKERQNIGKVYIDRVKSSKSQWAFLWPYLRQQRWPLIVGVLCVVIGTMLDQVGPWMVKKLIDSLSAKEGIAATIPYLGIMAAALIGSETLLYFQRLWVIQASRKIEYRLRNDLFTALQMQPRAFFDKHTIGDLMSRITNDLDRIRDFLGPVILHLWRMVSMIVFSLIAIFLISPKLGFYGIIPVLIVPFFVNRFLKKMHDLYGNIQKDLGELNSFVQDTLSGVEVMRAYGSQSAFAKKFSKASESLRDHSIQVSYFTAAMWPFIGLLGSLGILLVIWGGSAQALKGGLSIGSLSAALIYLLRLQFPLAGLGWVSNLFQRSRAAMERIASMQKQLLVPAPPFTEDISFPVSTYTSANFADNIEFKNLSFKYGSATNNALENISLKIPRGTTLGIVGPTGSGKTTLLNLLCGIYQPDSRMLYIDKKPVEEWDIHAWRSLFALAPQDGFLFSDTIESNILLGKSDKHDDDLTSTQKSVETFGEMAGFAKDLPQIEGGYQALLGERGINLSGGQRQRVGLARALIANTPILCLDDTLSALDTQTEKEILQNIKNNTSKQTVIITSHKYSAISHCDHIIYLQHGKILEQGSHSELMDLQGAYASVYEKQMISSALESV